MSLQIVERLLSKLSASVVEQLATSNFNVTASDEIKSEYLTLSSEIQKDRVNFAEKELESRIKLEEIEVQHLKDLNECLKKEIVSLELFMKHYSSQENEKPQLQSTILNYNKMIASSQVEEYINVVELMTNHQEDGIKRLRVKEMEKYTDQFAGLPPNIADAREAVRKLSQEIKSLKIKSELQTQQEVAQFNKTTLGYSSYSFKK